MREKKSGDNSNYILGKRTAALISHIKQWLPLVSMEIKSVVLEGNVILNSFHIFFLAKTGWGKKERVFF